MNLADLSWEIIALFGGVQAVLTALVGFLGKMWLDRTLQLEKAKIEAKVEKSLYMQKMQFDTEFQIYTQLWEQVYKVREAICAITFDREHSGDPKVNGSSFEERCKNYDDSFNSLKYIVESKLPFYPVEIAGLLSEMLDLSDKERKRDESTRVHGERTGIPIKGAANLYNLLIITGKICDAIRTRLTGTSIS